MQRIANSTLSDHERYLHECSKAEKAQEGTLQRLMKEHPPRDSLPRREVATRRGIKPPLHYYGFPFTKRYPLDYAKRHCFTVPLGDEDREFFREKKLFDLADKDVFDYGEVKASHLDDPDLRIFIFFSSRHLMIQDLQKRCGFPLKQGRPLSLEWQGIVALWSNHDVKERYAICYEYDEVVDKLRAAMNEGDGPESKLQWWFDHNNELPVLTSSE